MPKKKVNSEDKPSTAKVSKTVNSESVNSESVQNRQDARLNAVGDASDGKVTKGHNVPEKGASEFGPSQFPAELSDSVKARRERLKNGPVGDASEETTGKSYGVSGTTEIK